MGRKQLPRENFVFVQEKQCTKCKEVKDRSLFSAHKQTRSRLSSQCRICKNHAWKDSPKYKACNKRAQEKALLPENREQHAVYRRTYYLKNIDAKAAYAKKYRLNNMEMYRRNLRKYRKKRNAVDPLFKMTSVLRSRIKYALTKSRLAKNNFDVIGKDGLTTKEILGVDLSIVKKHIERQWKKGMNWENHGYNGWHIDHIIPLGKAKSKEEMIALCHYTNLQPMWASENIKRETEYLPFKQN